MKIKSENLVIIIITCLLAIGLLSAVLLTVISNVAYIGKDYYNACDKSVFGENALVANDGDNQSEKFKQCIATARENGKTLYIPSGVYIITESLTGCFYDIKITGDANGCTVIKNGKTDNGTVEFGKFDDYSRRENVSISNLFFDGVGINFRKADNAEIYGNIFYNSPTKFIVQLQAGKNMQVYNNIFLRDINSISGREARCLYVGGYGFGNEDAYGKPMTFAQDVYIRNNIFGAKIDELDNIAKQQDNGCKGVIRRLKKAIDRKKVVLSNNQNIITTGINSFYCLKNAYIENNYFHSFYDDYYDIATGKAELPCTMDHITYIRGAQDIFISGNFVQGWHNGPAGGFKFKSSNKITIVNNYLRNTGIIMSNHAEQGCTDILTNGGVSELKNWLIAENTFDFTQSHGAYGTGIYFELDNPEKVPTIVEDIVLLGNKYINYKNIEPAYMRLKIRFSWTDKADGKPYFTPQNTCSLNNTRDDTDNGVLEIDPWTADDYAVMRTDWQNMLSDAPTIEKYYNKIVNTSLNNSKTLTIVLSITLPLLVVVISLTVFFTIKAKRGKVNK